MKLLQLLIRSIILVMFALNNAVTVRATTKRVAVIGGGVGGSASAFFLNKLLGPDSGDVQIDLYEKSDRIGGRVYSVPFHGNKYEAGGSVIHPRNLYASSLSSKFGLLRSSRPPSQSHPRLSGIYDGSKFVFEESRYEAVNIVRLLWRYGLDIVRMKSLISRMLDHFSWIYLLQKNGKSFDTVAAMLRAMNSDYPALTNLTLREHLSNEISADSKLIDELVSAITLVNYGQNVNDLHAFVGSVSIAGADGGLWSIKGGNDQLPEQLAKRSRAHVHLNNQVKRITLRPGDGTYDLTDGNSNTITYDALIVAHPLGLSALEFVGFSPDVKAIIENESGKKDGRRYHQTVASFVAGKRTNYDAEKLAEVIVCEDKSFFYSRSLLTPLVEQQNQPSHGSTTSNTVYKVFSKENLTNEQLGLLFSEVSDMKSIPWLAYPEYSSGKSEDKLNAALSSRFLLAPGLVYVNAIEWAASAIEMSLIGAYNAALLVKKHVAIDS